MMNEDSSPLPQRLRAGSPGLGAPSAAEIEIRAGELARTDGRSAITEADLDRAAAELGGPTGATPAPELTNAIVEQVTTWDEPVDAEGHRVHENRLEDESSVAEQLIEEGLREADHDSRVAAAENVDPSER